MNFRNNVLSLMVGLLILTLCPTILIQQIRAQQPNLLTNPSFEGGWYDVAIGQVPDGWRWLWLDKANIPGTETETLAPESRVLPRSQIPPDEQSIFLQEGDACVKIFKPHSPIYAALAQDVGGLEVGRKYKLVAPVFVDTFDWEGKKKAPSEMYGADGGGGEEGIK